MRKKYINRILFICILACLTILINISFSLFLTIKSDNFSGKTHQTKEAQSEKKSESTNLSGKSENSFNWENISLGDNLNSIAYDGQYGYTIVGENGIIGYSHDTIPYRWMKIENKIKSNLNKVIWDGKQFICLVIAELL